MVLDVSMIEEIDLDRLEMATPTTIPSIPGSGYGPFDTIISNSVIQIIELIILIVLCGVVSLAGLVANVINVVVFIRQGALSSSSNVSLLALAVADIGCLFTVFCTSVGYGVMRVTTNSLFVSPRDFLEVTTLWSHITFVQITSWITAYIAFERCVCVVFPLKVKTLFSAKRSLIVLVTIAVFFTLSYIPIFATLRLVDISNPRTNTTQLMFTPTKSFMDVMSVSNYIHSMFFRALVLFMVFLCTQITVYHVKLSKSWRKSLANAEPDQNGDKDVGQTGEVKPKTTTTTTTKPHSNRERRLIRMVTLISIIFLVCNGPVIVVVFLLHSAPFFEHISPLDNFFRILLSSQFLLESINSSINIVVYYKMSSRYKQELRAWLGLDDNKTT